MRLARRQRGGRRASIYGWICDFRVLTSRCKCIFRPIRRFCALCSRELDTANYIEVAYGLVCLRCTCVYMCKTSDTKCSLQKCREVWRSVEKCRTREQASIVYLSIAPRRSAADWLNSLICIQCALPFCMMLITDDDGDGDGLMGWWARVEDFNLYIYEKESQCEPNNSALWAWFVELSGAGNEKTTL